MDETVDLPVAIEPVRPRSSIADACVGGEREGRWNVRLF